MSRIFDALQRAVAERTGGESARPAHATELLEWAEHQAFLTCGPDAAIQSAVLPTDAGVPPSNSRTPNGANPHAICATEDSAFATRHQYPSILDEFASLPITDPQSQLAFLSDSGGPGAEAFRLLAVRFRNLRHEKKLKKVLITSTTPREGKSFVSANLACSLASATHERVLLLEGDIRRPTLSKIFGLGAHPGLCEYLGGESALKDSAYKLEGAGVWLMPAGTEPAEPMDVLRSRLLPNLLEIFTETFDVVLIDSPPVLPLADASIWGRMADGILLVARQGFSEKRKLEKGLEGIDNEKLIGAILNSSTSMQESSYSYYRRDQE